MYSHPFCSPSSGHPYLSVQDYGSDRHFPAYHLQSRTHHPVNPFVAPPSAAKLSDFDEYRMALAHLALEQRSYEQLDAAAHQAAANRARLHSGSMGRFPDPTLIERDIIRHQREVAYAQAQQERESAFALAQQQRQAAHHQYQLARQVARECRQRNDAEFQARRDASRFNRDFAGRDRRRCVGLEHLLVAIREGKIGSEPTAPPAEKGVDKPSKTTSASQSAQSAAPAQSGTAQPSTGSADTAPPATNNSQQRQEKASKTEQSGFPEEINDLLSRFLGLRVDLLSSDATNLGNQETAKTNGVPKGLNEFLGRFGWEFQPSDVEKETKEEKSTVAGPITSSSEPVVVTEQTVPNATAVPPAVDNHTEKPVADTTPTTSTNPPTREKRKAPVTANRNEFTDIPPSWRDLISKIDPAIAERIQEKKRHLQRDLKGKAVAKGEKPTTATREPVHPKAEEVFVPASESQSANDRAPSPMSTESNDSTSSINKLNEISTELSTLKSGFTFPSRLLFSNVLTGDAAPPLRFDRVNSLYHAQANKLLQLLLQADSVSSGGDREVRMRRKAVVKDVEGAIEEIEKRKDKLWLEIKERREKGEEESEDEAVHSSGSSLMDVEESSTHAPGAEAHLEATNQAIPFDEQNSGSAKEHVEDVDLPEVPEAPTAQQVPIETAEVVEAEDKDKNEEENEEGYELI